MVKPDSGAGVPSKANTCKGSGAGIETAGGMVVVVVAGALVEVVVSAPLPVVVPGVDLVVSSAHAARISAAAIAAMRTRNATP
ncbi:MAG TPA: hypothetical protein VJA44_08785 [Acidimicrobiia bacterium]|nr:hypothetical protein [Acidimicrobiia bacterium]